MTRSAAFDPATTAELTMVLGSAGAAALRRMFLDEIARAPASIAAHFIDGDAAQGRAAAHALKGAALVVGATGVAGACDRLEYGDDDDAFDALEMLSVASRDASADGLQ